MSPWSRGPGDYGFPLGLARDVVGVGGRVVPDVGRHLSCACLVGVRHEQLRALWAKRWAIAAPIPRAAPVTSATLPSRRPGRGSSARLRRRLEEAGAPLGRDVAGADLSAAASARQIRPAISRSRCGAARSALPRGGEVRVAPAHEGYDGWEQVDPARGEAVLVAVRLGRVSGALQQAGVDERAQARRERRPRDPQVARELP